MAQNNKTWIAIVGWVVTIIAAIIGTYSAASQSQEQTQEQSQSLYININGQQVEINEDNAQQLYGDLEDNNEALNDEIDNLKETNEALSSENAKYKAYGTDALVSLVKEYDSDKVSLLAFDPVNSDGWKKNEGTLNDSLGYGYTVTLPYLVMSEWSYAEYYTNQNYSKLKFKIASHENMDQDNKSQIKIYADDILVFTSPEFDRKKESESYVVDINNAKFIKIECVQTAGYGNSNLLFLDSTLEK